jgi:hypothetical protein
MANKYSPIWEQLKTHGHVTLAVPVPLHKRVWRGLVNCKDRDVAFKYAASLANKRYIIEYIAEHARIKILLREFDDLSSLTVTDL